MSLISRVFSTALSAVASVLRDPPPVKPTPRPRLALCSQCGTEMDVTGSRGRIPELCDACRKARDAARKRRPGPYADPSLLTTERLAARWGVTARAVRKILAKYGREVQCVRTASGKNSLAVSVAEADRIHAAIQVPGRPVPLVAPGHREPEADPLRELTARELVKRWGVKYEAVRRRLAKHGTDVRHIRYPDGQPGLAVTVEEADRIERVAADLATKYRPKAPRPDPMPDPVNAPTKAPKPATVAVPKTVGQPKPDPKPTPRPARKGPPLVKAAEPAPAPARKTWTPASGATLAEIHDRLGLSYQILRGKALDGLLVAIPGTNPPRFTPDSVAALARCYNRGRA